MAYVIAFEGIDGTGKGTQYELAIKMLQEAGKRVKCLSFPVYESFFGQEIGAYLTGKKGVRADTVDSKSMALWFALDRFEALSHLDLSEYDVLLVNRYLLSNAVYQSIRPRDIGQPDILDFVLELEYGHFHIPEMDLCFVFDMDLEAAKNNVAKKGFRDYVGGDGSDIYESINDIQLRAREKYLEFSRRMPDIVQVISCMEDGRLKSIDEVSSMVRDVLQKKGLL